MLRYFLWKQKPFGFSVALVSSFFLSFARFFFSAADNESSEGGAVTLGFSAISIKSLRIQIVRILPNQPLRGTWQRPHRTCSYKSCLPDE